MVIPVRYRGGGEGALANYDYYDIAEGTGIKQFYVLTNMENGSDSNVMNTEALYSNQIEFIDASVAIPSSSYDIISDQDYDLSPFNFPKTVNGSAYLTWARKQAADAGVQLGYMQVSVVKVSGGTETVLGTSTTEAVSADASPIIECVKVDLTKTHFKKGDILRLTIRGWAKKNDGGSSPPYTRTVVYGTDPANRDGTEIVPSTDDPVSTTTTKLYIPFDLDL